MQKKKKKVTTHSKSTRYISPLFFFTRKGFTTHNTWQKQCHSREEWWKKQLQSFPQRKSAEQHAIFKSRHKVHVPGYYSSLLIFFFFPQKETRTSFQQFLLEEVHRKKNLHNLTPRVLTQQAAYISHSANAINAKRSVAAKQSNAVCCRGRPSLGFSGKQLLRINIWLRSSTINSSP